MRLLNVSFWKLAEVWGCSEITAIRRLRTELPPEKKHEVLKLIRQAAAEMEGEI